MSVNPSNIVIPVPQNAPHVTLPNGNTVALVIVDEDTPIGMILEPFISEATVGTSTFYAVLGDGNALTEVNDMWLALSDMLITSGVSADTMTPDRATFMKNWLSLQTYETAIKLLGPALTKLFIRIAGDLLSAYPGSSAGTPTPVAGAPKDPVDLLNYWLTKHVVLKVDPITGAVSATLS